MKSKAIPPWLGRLAGAGRRRRAHVGASLIALVY